MTDCYLSPHLQDPPLGRFRQGVVVDSHEQLEERMKVLPPSMKVTWISANAVAAFGYWCTPRTENPEGRVVGGCEERSMRGEQCGEGRG